jgi:hypothetical protein
MTFTEALRELGLEPSATAEEVRSSYLRRIERSRAEVDPEERDRLERAYELVLPLIQGREEAEGAAGSPLAETLSDDQAAAARDVAGAAHLVTEWSEHLKRKEIAAAIPKILRSLDMATRFPGLLSLPGDAILDLAAQLGASGDAIRARTLTNALRTWVETLPAPGDAFSPDRLPRWTMLDELQRAEPELSYTIYVALSRLIAENDPSVPQLLIRHQAVHPEQAEKDRRVLVARAPTLVGAVGALLQADEPPQNPRQSRWASRWLWLMALIIVANLAHMWSDSRRAPEADPYPSDGPLFAPGTPPSSSADAK